MTDPRTPAADLPQRDLLDQLAGVFGALDIDGAAGMRPVDTSVLAAAAADHRFTPAAYLAATRRGAATTAPPARPPVAVHRTAGVRAPGRADTHRGSGHPEHDQHDEQDLELQQGGVPPVAVLLAPAAAEGAVPTTTRASAVHQLPAAVQAVAAVGERPATRKGSAEPERRGRAAGMRVGARARALRAARPARWLLTAVGVVVGAAVFALGFVVALGLAALYLL